MSGVRLPRRLVRALVSPTLALAALAALAALSGCAPSTHLGRSDYARVRGQTYVIVGASSGFGRGAALRLGALGGNVVLAARRTDLLEDVAGAVRTAGGQALVVTTDIADPAQVEALATAATQRFGRIDVWMNIAGVGANGRFWDRPCKNALCRSGPMFLRSALKGER